MLTFLNGKFVSEEHAVVSVLDRSFCLGDGLFETLPFFNRHLFLWEKHFERLQNGAEFLKIPLPFSNIATRNYAEDLLRQNQFEDGMLRIQLSRGVGARGYSAKGASAPLLVMTVHPLRKVAAPARIVTSTVRISSEDPLSGFKTSSKLSHVVARTFADECGADEALLLNTEGNIAEATSSNFFWIENGRIFTPPRESGALPGVTRAFVLQLCEKLKIPAREQNISPESLARVEAVFLTSSGFGIREVSHVDGCEFSSSPLIKRLNDLYWDYAKGANHI